MGTRDNIKEKLQAWQEFAGEYQAKARAISSDESLSDRGKAEALGALRADNSAAADRLRAEALASVDAAIRSLEDAWSADTARRLGDATYQAALGKACAAVRDGSLDAYDLRALVGMFAGDHIAERQLAAAASGNPAMASVMSKAMPGGVDRARTIGNLQSIGAGIRSHMVLDGLDDEGGGFNNMGAMRSVSFQGNMDYLDGCADDCSVNTR